MRPTGTNFVVEEQTAAIGLSFFLSIKRFYSAGNPQSIQHHVHLSDTYTKFICIQVPARHACQEYFLVFPAGKELV